jgi:spore coat polysaccharide biosynthesis predicted glycosyltransferase SpsG
MRLGFRVATDPRFGAGHLARCRAVAGALDPKPALFADPGHMPDAERVHWDEIVLESAQDRAAAAIEALSLRRIDALVLDSYALDADIVAKAARAGPVAVFRDDRAVGPELLSIDCSPGAEPGAGRLAGPSFMPLPPVFATMHEQTRSKAAKGRESIMVAFGARDSANHTALAFDALRRLSTPPRTVAVVPRSALHYDSVVALLAELPWAERLDETASIRDVYAGCDLAIGAPGVSQYERACCGVPAILIAQNEMQKPLVAAWAETGAAALGEPDPQALAAIVGALMDDPERLGNMRARALDIVDGRGAERLANALEERLAQ